VPRAPLPFLARADVLHATGLGGHVAFGATGVALLRRLEALARERLERLGYREILLPAVCDARALEGFVGVRRDRLLLVDGRRPRTALAPFSEVLYAGRVAASPSTPRRSFQIAARFVREVARGPLDFGEYVKCEILSVHRRAKEARLAWSELNAALEGLCSDDLALAPVYGTRPPQTRFPGAERTWSAELPLGAVEFQTLAVSHALRRGVFAANGLPRERMNSACFSQKLLAAALLHHASHDELVVPSALAPAVGVVAAPPEALAAARRQATDPQRVRWLAAPGSDAAAAARKEHAVWSIAARGRGGRAGWELRAGPTTARFDDLGRALALAARAVALHDASLRARSRALREAALRKEPPVREPRRWPRGHHAITAACCPGRCERRLLASTPASAKLRFDGSGRCSVCGGATRGRLLLERSERYTSFYVASGGLT
jgi:hypothetical protein